MVYILPALSICFLFLACGPINPEKTKDSGPEDGANVEDLVYADDIPVAHTPGCGWEEFPDPILAECTEPLVEVAGDLRGTWEDESTGRIERIEQCGNRVVITSSGVIHDMRADGTFENGVNDVSGFNCEAIRVAAEFIDEILVLSPEGSSIQVKRWIEDDELFLEHPLISGRLHRIDD